MDITNTAFPKLSNYNYEADSIFRQLYTYARRILSLSINTLLPISSVIRVKYGNFIDYQVSYNNAENTLLRYLSSSTQPFSVISYTVMGIQLPILSNATLYPVSMNSSLSRTSVMQFLLSQDPILFNSSIIINFNSAEINACTVDILTAYGSYFTRVYYNSLLYLSTVTQTSTVSCSDLNSTESANNPILNSLNAYLVSSYGLSGFTLSLVQGYINSQGVLSYRMLYSSGSIRNEVQVVFSQSLKKYLITKVTQYQGGSCESGSVLLNNSCVRSCQSFTIWDR